MHIMDRKKSKTTIQFHQSCTMQNGTIQVLSTSNNLCMDSMRYRNLEIDMSSSFIIDCIGMDLFSYHQTTIATRRNVIEVYVRSGI
mmetsp:Transcript_12338/g.35793  ORF Transcript_12338/g.35793 Transcript_12338/m.35793 type:complete len:86 (-) Transcript_12338:202-459(-)